MEDRRSASQTDVGGAPRSVTLCGEKIVLVRDGGRVYGLHDRCPHRGVPLSCGRREFPGMLTCAYHGWTYDLQTGRLEVVLTDGPDSPMCGKANVRTYPVEERAGLIFVYVGDQPAPPVEADIPRELLRPDAVVEGIITRQRGWTSFELYVPSDANHYLSGLLVVSWAKGLSATLNRAKYRLWYRWAYHALFHSQDQRIIERMAIPPEQLYRPDASITAWRRLCQEQARGAPLPAAPEADRPAREAVGSA